MKIAVLSDTHRKFSLAKEAIDFLTLQGVKFIVHAGDICQHETLEYIKNTGLPYIVVYGNNDAHLMQYHDQYNLVQEPYYFKLAETKFKLMHLPLYMSNDAEVIIFGHTHHFEATQKGGSLYLNPGEVCAREKPWSEVVILDVESNNFIVNYYTKKANEPFALTKELRFQREQA